ncbi:hypothetical protein ROHU_012965 [Labeo rohita]|uniref:Uncharacterized protein n=1 Tax=Labeo rohita TaxID=84645 RepID=A0A498LD37_LABRO|nr:hypothetical protein ROHU_012965 [Labeo rohita]
MHRLSVDGGRGPGRPMGSRRHGRPFVGCLGSRWPPACNLFDAAPAGCPWSPVRHPVDDLGIAPKSAKKGGRSAGPPGDAGARRRRGRSPRCPGRAPGPPPGP